MGVENSANLDFMIQTEFLHFHIILCVFLRHKLNGVVCFILSVNLIILFKWHKYCCDTSKVVWIINYRHSRAFGLSCEQAFLLHPSVRVNEGDELAVSFSMVRSKHNHRLMDVEFTFELQQSSGQRHLPVFSKFYIEWRFNKSGTSLHQSLD